jgi:hypothetical protein
VSQQENPFIPMAFLFRDGMFAPIVGQRKKRTPENAVCKGG